MDLELVCTTDCLSDQCSTQALEDGQTVEANLCFLKSELIRPPTHSAETITPYYDLLLVGNSYKMMFYDVSELFPCIYILAHQILSVFMSQNW